MTIQVATAAFPRYAGRSRDDRRAQAVASPTPGSPALRRVVIDYTDELRRALAARVGTRALITTRTTPR